MKETHYTRFFKVKFSNGVRCLRPGPYDIAFHGYSRIDGFPIYKMRWPIGEAIEFRWVAEAFVINGRPGYTVDKGDLELIPDAHLADEASVGDAFKTEGEIIPVQPLSAPTGQLFYLDYVYGDSEDERLLFML